jgi:hypothetical protein
MEQALRLVGDYIASKGRNLTAVCVGGAVNLLLLRTRHMTHDIDMLGGLGNASRILLDEAQNYAQSQMGNRLGTDWLNTETEMWIAHQRGYIQELAERQNVVVFQHGGLTVLAAPWEYAFCTKIDRWGKGDQVRPYDLTDAAHYLNRWIRAHGGRPVPLRIVQRWAENWNTTMDRRSLLREFNREYRRLFGSDGIIP